MSRTPAIQTPREFSTPAGARAASGAIDAIRIRLERMESSQDSSGEALSALRTELFKAIAAIKVPPPAAAGRARSILIPAESMSAGDVVAISTVGAVRADTATAAHAGTVVGLVYENLSEGRISVAADSDIVSSEDWAWEVGDVIYAAADGAVADDPGAEAWMRRIGVAVDAKSILVLIGESIILGSDAAGTFLSREGGQVTERQAISARTGANSGVVAARADGVLDPSLHVIGQASDSASGIYTGAEGEAFIYPWECGATDEFGIDGNGRMIEI